jgi:hypothetical protein
MAFLRAFMILLTASLLAPAALAQQRDLGPPTGSISIRQLQVAFIASGEVGGGTLTFRGRTYGVTVGGLGIGGIGASTVNATGTAYGLRRRADFTGAYVQLREGWAVGAAGRGTLWLRNDKGVTLRLVTKRRGLQLSLGADGVLIGWK